MPSSKLESGPSKPNCCGTFETNAALSIGEDFTLLRPAKKSGINGRKVWFAAYAKRTTARQQNTMP
ncbi:hypothetical protein [Agrobacterium rosae]|uniref:hypothetical protein n=1 Tax=Agrobacterium rosae TaxID=1972867 RepID=UPI003BA1371F